MCLILTTYKQKNIILTMLKHTPTIILILVFCFCFSLFAPSLQAHIGGIPFINLNDKPTLVNDYNNYSGRTDIPQDDAPETFLINQPIKFEVIQKYLQIPEDVFKKSEFRWKFDPEKDQYQTGSLISHSFDQPKTYFSLIEVKGPEQSDFQPLNTLGINIVNDLSYKLPKVTLSAATDSNKPNRPVQYFAQVETDPTAQITNYAWDFDDGQTSSEQNPIHKFADENIIHGVTLKVTDSNGYISYTGLQVFENDNKLEISNIKPGETEVKVDTDFNSPSNISPYLYIAPGIVITALIIYLFKKRSTKK